MLAAEARPPVLCIAPHPDDETLGCGGTMLRHVAEGRPVHWLICTTMTEAAGFAAERIAAREREIEAVARGYGFAGVHRLMLPTTRLDTLPLADVVAAVAGVIDAVRPELLYVPWRHDAHSDHRVVFDAATACCKSFRRPFLKGVYAYETWSETHFGLRPEAAGFQPQLFVDISAQLERKLALLALFDGEMGAFPFPRSTECLRALAMLRGSQAGVAAAEAFVLLKELR